MKYEPNVKKRAITEYLLNSGMHDGVRDLSDEVRDLSSLSEQCHIM